MRTPCSLHSALFSLHGKCWFAVWHSSSDLLIPVAVQRCLLQYVAVILTPNACRFVLLPVPCSWNVCIYVTLPLRELKPYMHNELEVNFQSCTMAPVGNTDVTGLFSITGIPLLRGDCSAEQMFEGQDLNLYLYYLLMLFCHKLPCLAKLTGNPVKCMCNVVL